MDTWIFFAVLAPFGQALGWALKKKSLNNLGINNTVAFVSYLTASLVLLLIWILFTRGEVPETSPRFLTALGAMILINALAVWAGFKALDITDSFSKLMPLLAFAAILIIPVEFIFRGTIPNLLQIVGIVLIVGGNLISSLKDKVSDQDQLAKRYFLVTLVCYSISPVLMGELVKESADPIFSATLLYFGMTFVFAVMLLATKESIFVQRVKEQGNWSKVFMYMILAGLASGLLENGSSFIALMDASASEVFSIKRIMPIFVLPLGWFMFKDKIENRHILGTILMAIGSVTVIAMKG